MDLMSYILGKKAGGGGGVTPTGTIDITSNGVTDVTNYAYADVNVSGGGAEDYFATTTNQSQVGYLIKKLPEAEITATMLMGFSGNTNLVEIEALSTPNVANLASAFNYCSNLEKIKLITSSTLTSLYGTFYGCLKLNEISLSNTENVTSMEDCFRNCSGLVTIPQLNTNKVTSFKRFVYGCSNLENLPQLDFSSATDLSEMFVDCGKFTDASLNNILASCIGATSYTGTKTLTQLGIYSYRYSASRIQALSNYQAFLDAGWTIGY